MCSLTHQTHRVRTAQRDYLQPCYIDSSSLETQHCGMLCWHVYYNLMHIYMKSICAMWLVATYLNNFLTQTAFPTLSSYSFVERRSRRRGMMETSVGTGTCKGVSTSLLLLLASLPCLSGCLMYVDITAG